MVIQDAALKNAGAFGTAAGLNDPIHCNDSWDQLKMGIEGQNHGSDSPGAFGDSSGRPTSDFRSNPDRRTRSARHLD